ncbi:FMN-binding negative transcriptional regulator [Brevibacillus sp. FSL L8-0520]|jgi:transcriptional regulator|uniref:FMN-binding negative transcriptional regulator n=1 Tax=Brevibacillus sp. FSL L8-0710 TaxID=2975313 RepID=UPI001C11E39A|nr:FMN-binding negative transcriptional regulator [Brevibacillus borstelensis]MCC0567510.1 FMN-binding negative transcriptional regulator [Brevibacillus borstelensis]MCM3473644.1 FMN-binding negative transcriptional regulator [Brevibacillus borstelensis]MCM3559199.1 FMN-binding negative transcriptional regulator [Brevibacillus borstelensis]MED1745016.1 FMN-binding negative transcriptional regulator [Brevibacillus borstelensis]MED2010323.1 FMN-binding negative transcriptional regulator [Breviba
MMNVYIPKQYRMNHDEAVQMMKSYPFALLITVDEQRPLATHIPLEIREEEGKIYATGHIAYGNIQKKTLDHNRDVLLIFQGPHAYISSSWYEREEVPTWDYLAVHAYGTSRVLEKDELKSALDSMLKRYESHRENGRLWETFDPELLEREMKGIVGFEIEITSIEAAAKMSQNRSDTDYKSIVAELEKSEDQEEIQVAQWMREKRKGLFE